MNKLLLFLFAVLFTGVCMAEEVVHLVKEPEQVTDALKMIPVILGALKDGNYLLAGAFCSLVLTFLSRRFVLPKLKLGPGILPILSAVIGCVSGVGIAIAAGANVSQASLAVLSGPLASTLWDSVIKYAFKKS